MSLNPASVTVLAARPCEFLFSVGEVAGAADTIVVDLGALLAPNGVTRGGLYDFLLAAYADQAAARAAAIASLRMNVTYSAAALGGGGGVEFPVLCLDQNVSAPNVAGNFRLSLTGVKTQDAETATYFVQIEYRHSIVR